MATMILIQISLVPVLLRCSRDISLIAAFFERTSSLDERPDKVANIYASILEKIRMLPNSTLYRTLGSQHLNEHLSSVVAVISQVYKLGLQSQLDRFLARLASEASVASMNTLSTMYLSFLRILTPVVERLSLQTASMHDLYRIILNAYITKTLSLKPQALAQWLREKRGCGCSDCVLLDQFLASIRPIMEFNNTLKGKSHAEERLAEDVLSGRIQISKVSGSQSAFRVEKIAKSVDDTWTELYEESRARLLSIPQSGLKVVLGEQDYNLVLRLELITSQGAVPALGVRNNNSNTSIRPSRERPTTRSRADQGLKTVPDRSTGSAKRVRFS